MLPSAGPRNGRRGPGRKEPVGRRDLSPARSTRRGPGPPESRPCDRRAGRRALHPAIAQPGRCARQWAIRPGNRQPRRVARAIDIVGPLDRPGRVRIAERARRLGACGVGVDGSVSLRRTFGQPDAQQPDRRRGPDADANNATVAPAARAWRWLHANPGPERAPRGDSAPNPTPDNQTHAHADAGCRQDEEAASALPIRRVGAARSRQGPATPDPALRNQRRRPRQELERDRLHPATGADERGGEQPAALRLGDPEARRPACHVSILTGRRRQRAGCPRAGGPATLPGRRRGGTRPVRCANAQARLLVVWSADLHGGAARITLLRGAEVSALRRVPQRRAPGQRPTFLSPPAEPDCAAWSTLRGRAAARGAPPRSSPAATGRNESLKANGTSG